MNGGYACRGGDTLTEAELSDPYKGKGPFKGVKPGETIEVHWVHSSCDVAPGEGLGSCLSDGCENPKLRVEAQAFCSSMIRMPLISLISPIREAPMKMACIKPGQYRLTLAIPWFSEGQPPAQAIHRQNVHPSK